MEQSCYLLLMHLSLILTKEHSNLNQTSLHFNIHLFYIKENKGCNINSYSHRAITGKRPYPTWQLGTEQCWMSLKHLRAPPSASWDPARRTE